MSETSGLAVCSHPVIVVCFLCALCPFFKSYPRRSLSIAHLHSWRSSCLSEMEPSASTCGYREDSGTQRHQAVMTCPEKCVISLGYLPEGQLWDSFLPFTLVLSGSLWCRKRGLHLNQWCWFRLGTGILFSDLCSAFSSLMKGLSILRWSHFFSVDAV